ncbi:MAG: hypothetical protein U1G08_05530 [Verrucomicrobiota bacterium]
MLWLAIVGLEALFDGFDQFVNTLEDSPPNPLLGDLGEPAF